MPGGWWSVALSRRATRSAVSARRRARRRVLGWLVQMRRTGRRTGRRPGRRARPWAGARRVLGGWCRCGGSAAGADAADRAADRAARALCGGRGVGLGLERRRGRARAPRDRRRRRCGAVRCRSGVGRGVGRVGVSVGSTSGGAARLSSARSTAAVRRAKPAREHAGEGQPRGAGLHRSTKAPLHKGTASRGEVPAPDIPDDAERAVERRVGRRGRRDRR